MTKKKMIMTVVSIISACAATVVAILSASVIWGVYEMEKCLDGGYGRD